MSKLGNLRRLTLAAVALALAVFAGMVANPAPEVKAASKYTLYVGGGRAGISVDVYRPRVININVGDTVDFTNPFEEIHTVTFLGGGAKLPELIEPELPPRGMPRLRLPDNVVNPTPARGATVDGTKFVNSGILAQQSPLTSFSVTFPQGGSFEFVCIVHPFQTGVVNVLQPGTWVAPQSAIDDEAAAILQRELARGEGIFAGARPGKTTMPNGSTNHEVLTPGAPPGISLNRFAPARLQIAVGDTVTWNNPNPGPPHVVTFGATSNTFLSVEPGPGGPKFYIDDKVAFPVKPSQTYDGTGYYSSGIIDTGPGATGGSTFSLTFTRAGTYSYVCPLHATQGMAGVVEVGGGAGTGAGGSAGGGGIVPPNTGDAGLRSDPSMTPWLAASALVLVFGLGGLALIKARLRI